MACQTLIMIDRRVVDVWYEPEDAAYWEQRGYGILILKV